MSDAPMQLLEALARHGRDVPGKIAVREVGGEGRGLRYAELQERAERLAEGFRRSLPRGAVVMLCCGNVIEFPIALCGVLLAGCSVFPFSPDAARPELVRAAETSGAAAIIGVERVLEILRERVPVRIPIDSLEDPAEGFAKVDAPAGGGAALLLQTSGTTGRPGVVRRSSRSVDAVGRNMVEAIDFAGTDVVLSTVPLCHSYGVEHGLLAPLLAGSTVNLCSTFNLAMVIEQLQSAGVTVFPGVPSIFEMIGRLVPSGASFPTLRLAYSAGSVLPMPVSEMVQRRFNLRIGQVYGATEIGSVTFNDPHGRDFDPGSAGMPMRDVEIRTVTPGGAAALAGSEAQVEVSAPSMFDGYIGGDGSEISGGFFSTGDVGRLSASGKLTITGRMKLLIDVGGLKVNPTEVEQLLLEHPAVAECVVISVPLTETVNRLKALIIPRYEQQPPAAEELARFARARLTAYKVPRVFEMRENFPRTPTGKVLRHLIEA
jgi:acyl-CoA synthetase (AMP-forming)/AMP-acid ligase II